MRVAIGPIYALCQLETLMVDAAGRVKRRKADIPIRASMARANAKA